MGTDASQLIFRSFWRVKHGEVPCWISRLYRTWSVMHNSISSAWPLHSMGIGQNQGNYTTLSLSHHFTSIKLALLFHPQKNTNIGFDICGSQTRVHQNLVLLTLMPWLLGCFSNIFLVTCQAFFRCSSSQDTYSKRQAISNLHMSVKSGNLAQVMEGGHFGLRWFTYIYVYIYKSYTCLGMFEL